MGPSRTGSSLVLLRKSWSLRQRNPYDDCGLDLRDVPLGAHPIYCGAVEIDQDHHLGPAVVKRCRGRHRDRQRCHWRRSLRNVDPSIAANVSYVRRARSVAERSARLLPSPARLSKSRRYGLPSSVELDEARTGTMCEIRSSNT